MANTVTKRQAYGKTIRNSKTGYFYQNETSQLLISGHGSISGRVNEIMDRYLHIISSVEVSANEETIALLKPVFLKADIQPKDVVGLEQVLVDSFTMAVPAELKPAYDQIRSMNLIEKYALVETVIHGGRLSMADRVERPLQRSTMAKRALAMGLSLDQILVSEDYASHEVLPGGRTRVTFLDNSRKTFIPEA
jgi:hypothetical protein